MIRYFQALTCVILGFFKQAVTKKSKIDNCLISLDTVTKKLGT